MKEFTHSLSTNSVSVVVNEVLHHSKILLAYWIYTNGTSITVFKCKFNDRYGIYGHEWLISGVNNLSEIIGYITDDARVHMITKERYARIPMVGIWSVYGSGKGVLFDFRDQTEITELVLRT